MDSDFCQNDEKAFVGITKVSYVHEHNQLSQILRSSSRLRSKRIEMILK